jgi:uncharacterized protein YecT (DUF1311 family)
MKPILVLTIACLIATPSRSDDAPNCADPPDQPVKTQCAQMDFEKAEAELNKIWPELKLQAEEEDKSDGPDKHDFADALTASQQSWTAFRDAECKWQSYAAKGDALEPMLVSICKAKLTRGRIKQLQTGVSE